MAKALPYLKVELEGNPLGIRDAETNTVRLTVTYACPGCSQPVKPIVLGPEKGSQRRTGPVTRTIPVRCPACGVEFELHAD